MSQRKIILYIATSLDGFIARENGELDWLPGSSGEEDPEANDCGYGEFIESVDTVLMGNKTYQQILSFDVEYPYKDKANFVFSKTPTTQDQYAQFIHEDVESFISKLKSAPGKDIWLVGGGQLASLCIKNNLVDEVILFVIPIMIGKGIRLFQNTNKDVPLKLIESHHYTDESAKDIIKLRYTIKK